MYTCRLVFSKYYIIHQQGILVLCYITKVLIVELANLTHSSSGNNNFLSSLPSNTISYFKAQDLGSNLVLILSVSAAMEGIRMWVVLLFCIFHIKVTHCVEEEVKSSMISFLAKLSGQQSFSTMNWKGDSDPCTDLWQGVACDSRNVSVRRLFLDRLNLSGTLDAAILCNSQPLADSLIILSLGGNNVRGGIADEIGNCKQITRLYLGGNQLSGELPPSLAVLNNLKRLDISNNKFSGHLPGLSRISGLNVFLAQNNNLSGAIPGFDFSNLYKFNVSFNNFSGRIPDVHGRISEDSFLGNPELCGQPLQKNCAIHTLNEKSVEPNGSNEMNGSNESKGPSKDQILMYSGYAALGLVIILFILYKLCTRKKKQKAEASNKVASSSDHDVFDKPGNASSGQKSVISRSEFSVNSEGGTVSQSLILLTQPVVSELRLEDLLRAPAELLGRGKYGSLYKVMLDNRKTVVVKRIKDSATSSHDFKLKMETLGQVKHPYVLSPLAFYCSNQEKLLVYEFQENGSLFQLLHGESKGFDWTSRLGIAAMIAEGLAFMHQEVGEKGIAHGNLKSSNILLSHNMEARISEYGVMSMDDELSLSSASPRPSGSGLPNALKADVYGFGVILLELLTGKLVKNDGIDLAEWVQSVVREEWTGEVFDKELISEYASEERLVNLLRMAIKCVHRSPVARPCMNQVALMVNTIKDEEEKSLIYEA
ncbi:probable inactive receptor kinase At2g26730 [Neltuma alba]|uniref:probable inactive receptor kinase At2g26730 n=1 Tax=Neltuma alba TaxID=207710 RepID=UPI0010A2C556|nr:probable inactive receptor kinase At2g26730 [Prosopis alba]